MASQEQAPSSLVQAGASIKDKFTSLFKSGADAEDQPATSSSVSPTITDKLKSLSSNLKSVNPFSSSQGATVSQKQAATEAGDDLDLAADYHYISNLDDDQVQMNPGNMRLVISEEDSSGHSAVAAAEKPDKAN